jgi:hypothetical protein
MNYEKACKILHIDNDDEITMDILKKQYRINALRYHPDKNIDEDTTSKFQEIQSAYEYLSHKITNDESVDMENEMYEGEEDMQNSYAGILFSFMKNLMQTDMSTSDNKSGIYYIILEKISNTCEKKALELIEKVDKKVLIKLYEIIGKYSDALHFSSHFIEKMNEIITKKIEKDECIILNPTIDDLFENNLYKLSVNGMVYIVPLWHNELVYDNMGNDLYVKCFPMLPDNVSIDDKNNIYISATFDVKEILNKEVIRVGIGKREFEISPSDLMIQPYQTIALKGKGISKINTVDIYDISKKSNILVNISLL